MSAMVNLIGELPDPAAVLAVEGAHLHRYGKAPRPGRKVGHITVTAPDEPTLETRLAALPPLILGDVEAPSAVLTCRERGWGGQA